MLAQRATTRAVPELSPEYGAWHAVGWRPGRQTSRESMPYSVKRRWGPRSPRLRRTHVRVTASPRSAPDRRTWSARWIGLRAFATDGGRTLLPLRARTRRRLPRTLAHALRGHGSGPASDRARQPAVNAFVTVYAEHRRGRRHEESDRRFAEGRVAGPLDGIPVGIKDLSPTAGIRTTRGSRVSRMERAQPKTPRSSSGSSAAGRSSSAKPTRPSSAGSRRPTIPSLVRRAIPGISSGPRPAPAAGQPRRSPAAWGRSPPGATAAARFASPPAFAASSASSRPSVWCRCFRLPSSGTFVSEGPLSRTVRDSALMLGVIAGADPRDIFSAPGPDVDYLAACDSGIAGLRVAWSPDLGYAAVDPAGARDHRARGAPL